MTTHAGEMVNTVQANPQWVPADGKPYYVLDPKQPFRSTTGSDVPAAKGWRNDYVRNTGWQGRRRGLGPIGWIFCVPYDPGAAWRVATATDASEAALTTPPTVNKPPAGIK